MAAAPSGEQHRIEHGDQRATVVEVGGGIREYSAGGREVLESYAEEDMADGAHGAPLIPWPNRLADGRYSFDGADYRVPLTEPEKDNAIHGFLRWRPWLADRSSESRVVMETRIHPMAGYPFDVGVAVAYALGDDGLEVTTTLTNLGGAACPVGSGQHPYLSAGGGPIDECTLQLEAQTRILTDAERQLPTGAEDVAGTDFDFHEPRALGAQAIDFAFTGLARRDGIATVRLSAPDGATAELWVDEGYPYVELFTGDTLAPGRRRTGLGCEPMTCPPNAFQSGEGLVRLEPGESVTTRWGARLA